MNPLMTIAKKEWRSAFLSPVGLVFLGVFLLASLFVFFFMEGFFARNVADAKPFFRWMPVLLVLLTSAFSMRLWSEEARTGTMEVLMTLPLRIREIVLGKFIAGMGLVVVALALTLPVPLTIASLGDLDWGPVIGGYLGLLLLSAAYLALGMFISSLTSDQLVALLMSMVVCGLFVLVGYLPDLLPMALEVDEILRAVGTGSRFESMLRGVLDLRDLAFYLSLAALFLVLNGFLLERRRWGQSPDGAKRRNETVAGVGLLACNLLVLNIGLFPIVHLRADLTEWGEYSVSEVTEKMLASLSEPLLIRGYFSDQTHPLLDPLVPRIRDYLWELEAVGGANLTTEFVDPTRDEESEGEAQSKYGIRSVAFRFSDRHEDSVVNAYFHLLVRYGDQYEVIDFNDLIDVELKGTGVQVRLRNLEYDIARAVKKVVFGFKSTEAICAQMKDPAVLKVFASSKNMPEELAGVRPKVEKVAAEFKERCNHRFDYQIIDPDGSDSQINPNVLYQQYGIKPMALSMFDDRTFYLHLILESGTERQILDASRSLNESDIRKELTAALQRQAPGFLKTIAIMKTKPQAPTYPGMPNAQVSFQMLERQLAQTYEVTQVDLQSGRVGGEIDVLVVPDPADLSERELYALDQFLMRGGSVVVGAGKWEFDAASRQELNVKRKSTGLDEFLLHHGVEVGEGVVLDRNNAAFPVPVTRMIAGHRFQEIRLVNYPPFVKVAGEGLSRENPATSALPMVVMHWPSSVKCKDAQDGESDPKATCSPLLSSSEDSWAVTEFSAQPDFQSYPEMGFAQPEQTEKHSLAVSLTGVFESYFKDRKPPVLGEDDSTQGTSADKDKKGESKGHRAGLVERSEAQARLIVVGSASFLQDLVLSISGQVSQADMANLQFANNLIDWSVEDVDLLKIRAKERYARALAPIQESGKAIWEILNFGFALLSIVVIGLVKMGRRNRAVPMFDRFDDEGQEGGNLS